MRAFLQIAASFNIGREAEVRCIGERVKGSWSKQALALRFTMLLEPQAWTMAQLKNRCRRGLQNGACGGEGVRRA